MEYPAGPPADAARRSTTTCDARARVEALGRARDAPRAFRLRVTDEEAAVRCEDARAVVEVAVPLRFRFARTRGRADVTLELARAAWGDARGGGERDDASTSERVDEGWVRRARCVVSSGGGHAVALGVCLQVAFPETTRRLALACAACALARMALKSADEGRDLGVMDAPVVVKVTRAALVTRALALGGRILCPSWYAHATAASALLSVKVLLKQPPLRASLGRAMRGVRGEMNEDERIALWHTRYRWAALRLAKHIPSDPVKTIDDAPLMGLLLIFEGIATRIGSLNSVEGGDRSFSMSFPASWNAGKRARRRIALSSKRAIESEGRIHPVDVLGMVRRKMQGERIEQRISSVSAATTDVDGDRDVAVADDLPGREIAQAGAETVAETNIWSDRQLASAAWAKDGMSMALTLRAMYLFVTWLPVLTFAIPLLMLSRIMPEPISATLRKRAWSTLHSAISLCGAAFIKWAQWASTREDVFPKDLCEQLEQLHDDAPRHSYKQTIRILSQELGCDPRLIFVQFSKIPMASGSVAQVYKARLRKEVAAMCSSLAKPRKLDLNEDGTMDVAVKVRHPNVAKRIFLDFQILRSVAGFMDSLPALRGMQLKNTLGQFSHTMTSQTNLRNEADHLLKFTHNMKHEVQIAAPRPVPGLATESVLVETFMKGDGLGNAIKRRSSRNSELCSLGVHTYLLMLLRDNFIHQDLHPGNILYSVQSQSTQHSSETHGMTKLELIDFGIADELPQSVRNKFIGFLCFLLRGEGEKAADVALTWDSNQTCTDRVSFRRDMALLVASNGDIFTQRVDLNDLLKEIMQLFRKHSVSIDGIYASLVVSLCVLVGFATSLDPEINLFEVAAPSVMAFALTGNVVGRLFE